MQTQYQILQETLVPVGQSADGFIYAAQYTPGSRLDGYDQGGILSGFNCFTTCTIPASPNLILTNVSRVDFSQPISAFTALGVGLFSGNGAELLAYNSADQLVGHCFASFVGVGFSDPGNCYTITSGDESSAVGNMMVKAPNISIILFGSMGTQDASATGFYYSSVPEPGLSLLFLLSVIWIWGGAKWISMWHWATSSSSLTSWPWQRFSH